MASIYFKSWLRRRLFGKSFLSVVSTATSPFSVPKVLRDAKTAETWWPMTFLRQGQCALGKSLQGLRSSLGRGQGEKVAGVLSTPEKELRPLG